MKARRPDPELRRWWRELIDAFEPQRWTVAEYCRRRDVSTTSFYAWRRKLENDLAAQPEAAGSPAFLPIQIAGPPARTPVRVHLPGGVRVGVPSDERELLLDLIGHVTLVDRDSSP